MALSCPKCKSDLYELSIEGMSLDICEGCKGVWFDKDELTYYLKASGGFSGFTALESNAVALPYPCPRCGQPLSEIVFAPGQNLLIDRCFTCHGVWLDKDEFKKAKRIIEKVSDHKSGIYTLFHHYDSSMEVSGKSRNRMRSISSAAVGALAAWAVFLALYPSRKGEKNIQAETVPRPAATAPNLQKCAVCDGLGKKINYCDSCKGKGFLAGPTISSSHSCPDCNGSGKHYSEGSVSQCIKCGGNGWTVASPVACVSCNGTGQVASTYRQNCSACYGSGQIRVRETCGTCGGSGRSAFDSSLLQTCPSCRGSGTTESKRSCPHCRGGSIELSRSKACSRCKGRGSYSSERQVCDECFGTGQLDSSRTITCSSCHGKGTLTTYETAKLPCASCQGKGRLGESFCNTCNGEGFLKI